MACGKDHSGEVPKAIGNLPDSQAGFWRHRCAGCAYLMGRAEGLALEKKLRAEIEQLRVKAGK